MPGCPSRSDGSHGDSGSSGPGPGCAAAAPRSLAGCRRPGWGAAARAMDAAPGSARTRHSRDGPRARCWVDWVHAGWAAAAAPPTGCPSGSDQNRCRDPQFPGAKCTEEKKQRMLCGNVKYRNSFSELFQIHQIIPGSKSPSRQLTLGFKTFCITARGRVTSTIGSVHTLWQMYLNGVSNCKARPIGTSSNMILQSNIIVMGPAYRSTRAFVTKHIA